MSQHEYYAVLTGDIIRSTSLSQSDLEMVRSGLLEAVDEVRDWKPGLVKGKAEFFRGDAWQLLLTNPGSALRVGLFLRASLRAQGKADSRISIGIGKVRTISDKRVSLSTGEAFILSGHGLDRMTQYFNLEIEVSKLAGTMHVWLPIVAHLCDSLVAQWTERQAEIICLAAQPNEPTHGDIARKLSPKVTKQAVTKALNIANWHVIREAIRCFENTAWEAAVNPKNPKISRQP